MTTAESMFDDLLRRYAEPQRHYHTARHLAEMHEVIDAFAAAAADEEAVRLATWFHDAIYDPTGKDNEGASAVLAEQELTRHGMGAALAAEVARLVRLTASHDPAPGDRNGALLCDADLAVLAADADRYARYVADVRAEYAHVGDPTFAVGRLAVLERLVARKRIFRTAAGYRAYEKAARSNLAREIAALRESVAGGA